MFIVTALISWLWMRGIDKMKNEHPDYKGEDFLNFENDEKENNNNK
jgi:hypothetical protein